MKEIEKASDIDIRRAESAALLCTARGYIPISKLLIRERKPQNRVAPGPSPTTCIVSKHWHRAIPGHKTMDMNLEEKQISKQIHSFSSIA